MAEAAIRKYWCYECEQAIQKNATEFFFRGQRIWEAVMNELLLKRLGHTKQDYLTVSPDVFLATHNPTQPTIPRIYSSDHAASFSLEPLYLIDQKEGPISKPIDQETTAISHMLHTPDKIFPIRPLHKSPLTEVQKTPQLLSSAHSLSGTDEEKHTQLKETYISMPATRKRLFQSLATTEQSTQLGNPPNQTSLSSEADIVQSPQKTEQTITKSATSKDMSATGLKKRVGRMQEAATSCLHL